MKKSFKQRCIELRLRDYTLNEIMDATGRSKTTVYFHIKDIPLSDIKRANIAENSRQRALQLSGERKGVAKRPFKPFTRWNPELVLLVSHLMFDGELKRNCVYNNRSTALIRRVQTLMEHVYDFPPKETFIRETGVTRIGYYNVALTNFLREKSKELCAVIGAAPLSHQREFIRAFFDDEGCMSLEKKGSWGRIRGYQKDRTILLLIQKLLSCFGIESKLQGKNEVVITGKENLKKFQKEINFSEGVRINPNRTNSLWKKNLEKRKLLEMAIDSYVK